MQQPWTNFSRNTPNPSDWEDFDFSLDPHFNKQAYWLQLTHEYGYCGYCGPNKGENFGNGSRNNLPWESWKRYRRYQTRGRRQGSLKEWTDASVQDLQA